MKICAAQTKPLTGDISGNIVLHQKFISLAVSENADVIIFPELSLTGYEPSLASSLAITPDDNRLDEFQTTSNSSKIVIGVGIPTKNTNGINISMIIFQPFQPLQVYSKKYLHADEEPFFVSGSNFPFLNVMNVRIALAVCYELSVEAHAEEGVALGADIYFASVAKTARGVSNASLQLAAIAKTYAITTVMSNCIGINDGEECAGTSGVWSKEGILVGKLNDKSEGIIIIDTLTNELTIKTL